MAAEYGMRQPGTGNRSHTTAGQPDGAPINAHIGSTPKRMQSAAPYHPSTTAAQVAGRGHPVAGVAPAATIRADDHRGKPTPTPALACGSHIALTSLNGAQHSPERGDCVLDEATISGGMTFERHHSCTGPKIKGC